LFAAAGSQSCVLLPAHITAHIAERPEASRQQTWPVVQSAVAAHFSAISPPAMQGAPCSHFKSNPVPPSPGATQHTCVVVLQELVPQVSPPLEPPLLLPLDPPLLLPLDAPLLLPLDPPLLLPLELDPPLLEVLPLLLPPLDDAVPLLLPLLLPPSPLPPSPSPPPPLVPEEPPHATATRPVPIRIVQALLFMRSILLVHRFQSWSSSLRDWRSLNRVVAVTRRARHAVAAVRPRGAHLAVDRAATRGATRGAS
jgi:hypothetical protein